MKIEIRTAGLAGLAFAAAAASLAAHAADLEMYRNDARRFADKVREFVPDGSSPKNMEAFELSEYGRTLSHGEIVRFFSFATI